MQIPAEVIPTFDADCRQFWDQRVITYEHRDKAVKFFLDIYGNDIRKYARKSLLAAAPESTPSTEQIKTEALRMLRKDVGDWVPYNMNTQIED